jgi:cytochrome c oxidase assembly protein subunit 15
MRRLVRDPTAPAAPVTAVSAIVIAILFIQLLLGAWVAGLNAGHASYNWPFMYETQLVPQVDWTPGFAYMITHDPTVLHFLHRWWAWVAVAALVFLARRVRGQDRMASIALQSAVGTMVLLGIATVLSAVALWLAAAHQLVGALTVAATAWAAHVDGMMRQSERG